MSIGGGNLQTNQKQKAVVPPGPPGPPFLPTSAESGLHVDPGTGAIRLGSGGVNPLLANTEIQQAGFDFEVLDGGQRTLGLRPGSGLYQFGNSSYLTLEIDEIGGLISLGDLNPLVNGTQLQINDTGRFLSFLDTIFGPTLLIDDANQYFFMGMLGVGNGNVLEIDDLNRRTRLGASNGLGNVMHLTIDDAALLSEITFGGGSNRVLSLDVVNALYAIGDIDGPTANRTRFQIDDTAQRFDMITKVGVVDEFMLTADFPNGQYAFGDLTPSANGSQTLIDDITQVFTYRSGPGRFIMLDGANLAFQMGDLDGTGNQSYIDIDDTAQQFQFFSFTATPGAFLNLDVGNNIYQIGDISGVNSGTVIEVLDLLRTVSARQGSFRMINLDQIAQRYQMGDLDGGGTGTKIDIQDLIQTIDFTNTGLNATLAINGTPGFSGTVSPVVSITVVGGLVTNVT